MGPQPPESSAAAAAAASAAPPPATPGEVSTAADSVDAVLHVLAGGPPQGGDGDGDSPAGPV